MQHIIAKPIAYLLEFRMSHGDESEDGASRQLSTLDAIPPTEIALEHGETPQKVPRRFLDHIFELNLRMRATAEKSYQPCGRCLIQEYVARGMRIAAEADGLLGDVAGQAQSSHRSGAHSRLAGGRPERFRKAHGVH